MGVGGGASRRHALADPGGNIRSAPIEQPGKKGRPHESTQDPVDQAEIDRHAILMGDQNVIEQGHGQIRRHQASCRAGQGKAEAQGNHAGAARGKAQQAEQRAVSGRCS